MSRADGWVSSLPERYRPLAAVLDTPPTRGLDAGLLQLMAIRQAQMKGCARCAELHGHLARWAYVPEEKLSGLATWREVRCYSENERAALAWIEAATTADQAER